MVNQAFGRNARRLVINVPQQPHVLLFMKKSRTISQHFNMENIGTSAPRSAMKIIVVALKIQVRVYSKFEFGHSAIQISDLLTTLKDDQNAFFPIALTKIMTAKP